VDYSVTLRNNQLDAVETTLGASPKLQIRSGAKPANCAAEDAGTLLAELTLPSDWMAAASSGSKAKAGTWSGAGGAGAGAGTSAGHFRVKDSTGTTCHIQGSITASGGGGDMTLDNVSIANGQAFSVQTFTITAGNAGS
jgi:hypothetical protein